MVHKARGMTIRILVVDNDSIVRAGLHLLINKWPHMKVIGVASRSSEALEIVARENPDIILLEPAMGDKEVGFKFLSALRSRNFTGHVILLTCVPDIEMHYRAMRLGAVGAVSKTQPIEDLRNAILKVHRGEAWIDHKLIMDIITSVSRTRDDPTDKREKRKIDSLTKREREVVELISEGLKNKAIAEGLFISETTVRHHLTSIFSKLGVSDRFELLIYLYRHKLNRSGDVHAAEKTVGF